MPFVEDSVADNARLLAATDTILLGRRTYAGFSGYWPEQDDEFAALMNTPRKLVFASPGSLTEVTWGSFGNAELVDRDVDERLRALKAEDGPDVVVLASGGLVSSLLPRGLVDELQIVVVPVVLGSGLRYLRDVAGDVSLALGDVTQYPKGSVRLTYRVT
jgi:dihydrofolate reductase